MSTQQNVSRVESTMTNFEKNLEKNAQAPTKKMGALHWEKGFL